ncbi:hypothetical protein EFW58_03993 [Bacillus velezensis]|nr:hypothetical protein EFW58_03993 [Bacillus velezensis]
MDVKTESEGVYESDGAGMYMFMECLHRITGVSSMYLYRFGHCDRYRTVYAGCQAVSGA